MDRELQEMFEEAYGQEHISADSLPKNIKGIRKERNITSPKYSEFLQKYGDLDKYMGTFKSQDLVYFFREKSKENGNYYTIRNMKRDMGIFKKLLLDYSPVEICLMIEFLFESGQTYLPTNDLQPTVLASSWCVTVYADAVKWADGEFNPNTSHKKMSVGEQRNAEREWHSSKKTKSKATLGEWGD